MRSDQPRARSERDAEMRLRPRDPRRRCRPAPLIAAGLLACLLAVAPARLVSGQSNAGQVRVVQMAPNVPAVDVLIDDQRIVPALPYRAASGYAAVPGGTHTLQLTPSGGTEALLSLALRLSAGQEQTVVVLGRTPDLAALVLDDDNQAPPAGKAAVRFVHAGADVPAVDIAVAGSGGPPLFSDVAFRGVAGPVDVDAGTYDLELRAAGTRTVLLTLPSVTLEAGTVVSIFGAGLRSDNSLTAVQVPYPLRGTQPVTLGASGQGTPAPSTVLPVQMPQAGSGGPPDDHRWLAALTITLGLVFAIAGLACRQRAAQP